MIGRLFCKLFGHKRRKRQGDALRCPRCGDMKGAKPLKAKA